MYKQVFMNLANQDKDLIQGLIDFNSWLQQQLLEKRISLEDLPKSMRALQLMQEYISFLRGRCL